MEKPAEIQAKSGIMTQKEIKIEYVEINKLKPYLDNPNAMTETQKGMLKKSLSRFGFVDPVIIDQNNTIVGGHHRVEQAEALGLQKVPVVRLELSENDFKLLNVGLNQHSGTFNTDKLKNALDVLKGFGEDLEFAGFGEKEIAEFTNIDDAQQEIIEDEPPEIQEAAITESGDLWIMDKHRLLCGDVEKEENITRLMNGPIAEIVQCGIYDPPWDRQFSLDLPKTLLVFGDGYSFGAIISQFGSPAWVFVWDCVTSWYVPNRPLRRMKLCAWYGELSEYNSDGAFFGKSGQPKQVSNSRGSYWYVGDPRGKHLSDIFQSPITQLHNTGPHPHEKPIAWIRLLIGNCTRGLIYDPFCGSGASIIAAEQLDRQCYGLEIEPRYCDVIVRRWQNLTNKQAKTESGKTIV